MSKRPRKYNAGWSILPENKAKPSQPGKAVVFARRSRGTRVQVYSPGVNERASRPYCVCSWIKSESSRSSHVFSAKPPLRTPWWRTRPQETEEERETQIPLRYSRHQNHSELRRAARPSLRVVLLFITFWGWHLETCSRDEFSGLLQSISVGCYDLFTAGSSPEIYWRRSRSQEVREKVTIRDATLSPLKWPAVLGLASVWIKLLFNQLGGGRVGWGGRSGRWRRRKVTISAHKP